MRHELIEKGTAATTNGLGRTMDRRGALRLMLGIGAAAVAGGAGLARVGGGAARSADGELRTTTPLNLRSKPSTSAKVLLVLPKGAVVTNQYAEQNGFIKVGYQGTIGWAYGAYLEPADAGNEPTIIGQGVTKTAVNFRSGPSTSNSVLKVLPKGTIVDITDLTKNGFRYAISGGRAGWISDQYLAPYGGEGEGPAYFTTTTAVNLRAKPSTSAKVLLVVPAGAVVADYDLVLSNGYRGVDYNGTVGWIYDAYLA